ncbi:MAG TPA: MFS transporter [Ktedonobacteraceae bacterium]|nr:MFS transporter [Ktedonobacteraceae bacterium]
MISRITILAPLRHRAFSLLFGGQVISDLGDWLDLLALLSLITFTWKLGAGALAALSVALILPSILVAPFAGVWVDRWPRRTVMIACDLARAVVVLGLVWAPNLYVLLALVLAAGIFTSFFDPARQATIRFTVPEDDLLAANSLSQLSTQITKVIGPAIGGVIVLAAGPKAAFVADSLSFLLSAIILSQLPSMQEILRFAQNDMVQARHSEQSEESAGIEAALPSQEEQEEAPKSNFWSEFVAGISYIVHRKVLAIAVGSMMVTIFIIFTFDSLAALSVEQLGLNQAYLGLAVGSVGLGTAIGAVIVGQWGNRFHPLGLIGAGKVMSGVLVAILGLALIIAIRGVGAGWLPIWLLMGLAGAAIFVPYGYILQKETPPQLMGRVSSAAIGLQTFFQVLAPPLGALFATLFGLGYVFAVAGVAMALVGVFVLLVLPQVRAAEAKEDAGVEAPPQAR